MGHEIYATDNFAEVRSNGERAWHNLGIAIPEGLSAFEAGVANRMFWPVEQWGLAARSQAAIVAREAFEELLTAGEASPAELLAAYQAARAEELEIADWVANIRCDGDLKSVLGVVGAGYEVCQNQQLAEFSDALAQTGKCVVETCGTLRGGKRVFFLCRAGSYQIGSDKNYQYLLVANGHDGGSAINVVPTDVRVVCANTRRMVLGSDETNVASAAFSVRHCGNLKDKLVVAREALRQYDEIQKRNVELCQRLADRQIDRGQVTQLFAGLYSRWYEVATDDELRSTEPQERRIAELRFERQRKATDAFLKRYNRERETLGMSDNVWLAYNAVSGYLQHDQRARGANDAARVERRMESNLFGLNVDRSLEAFAQALAIAS